MQITIQHNDIEQAVKEFLANKGLTLEGKDVSVVFQTTRKGGPKVSATVNFTDRVREIPGFAAPALALVTPAPVAEPKEADHEQENQDTAAHQASTDAEGVPAEGSNSLFGN